MRPTHGALEAARDYGFLIGTTSTTEAVDAATRAAAAWLVSDGPTCPDNAQEQAAAVGVILAVATITTIQSTGVRVEITHSVGVDVDDLTTDPRQAAIVTAVRYYSTAASYYPDAPDDGAEAAAPIYEAAALRIITDCDRAYIGNFLVQVIAAIGGIAASAAAHANHHQP